MTTETNHSCPACGAALAPPPEAQAPQPARKAYMIEYHAPAGVAYEPIITDDPAAFLARAKESAANGTFKAEDFEPDDNALRIQQIIIADSDGVHHASWIDPDNFAQLHADEILALLEELIGSVEDAREARSQLDQDISTIEDDARGASLDLDRMRRKGGVQ
jgi:hypothetical protein